MLGFRQVHGDRAVPATIERHTTPRVIGPVAAPLVVGAARRAAARARRAGDRGGEASGGHHGRRGIGLRAGAVRPRRLPERARRPGGDADRVGDRTPCLLAALGGVAGAIPVAAAVGVRPALGRGDGHLRADRHPRGAGLLPAKARQSSVRPVSRPGTGASGVRSGPGASGRRSPRSWPTPSVRCPASCAS
jgi:hypothetical protein